VLKKLSSSSLRLAHGLRNSPAMNNQGLSCLQSGLTDLGTSVWALLIATILFGFSAPFSCQAVTATLLGTVADTPEHMAGANVTIAEMSTASGRQHND